MPTQTWQIPNFRIALRLQGPLTQSWLLSLVKAAKEWKKLPGANTDMADTQFKDNIDAAKTAHPEVTLVSMISIQPLAQDGKKQQRVYDKRNVFLYCEKRIEVKIGRHYQAHLETRVPQLKPTTPLSKKEYNYATLESPRKLKHKLDSTVEELQK